MRTEENTLQLSDKKHFDSSLQNLHDRLLQYYYDGDTKTVIIALSRKGPKMVDAIFSAEERGKLDIVTEFAMPIFFSRIPKGSKLRVFILDDAVYYGSTLLNLYNEIKRYEILFDITLEVKAFVAIKDANAMYLPQPEIIADEAWRNGCGHYFVREAMSRFRRLHQCMEVEFPIITYSFGRQIHVQALGQVLARQFGEKCYTEQYEEGSTLNVVLNCHQSQFCKIRLYPDGTQLHVSFMAPRLIPNDESILRRLMSHMDNRLADWWSRFCAEILKDQADVKTVEALKRSRHRNIVSMANYIFSYQEYILNKNLLEMTFQQIDSALECKGLDEYALYQVIGDKEMADDLLLCLSAQARHAHPHFPNIPSIPLMPDGLNYEEPRNPSEEERRTLSSHNWHMIRNSHSYKEALSAIFFNQNLFIERWSRTKARYEARHLWFGYTHDSLMSMLREHGRFSQPDNIEIALHRWIDNRIDMGCIVPQYILDYATNQWTRVFRPGENEELLLSHLGRFAIHVYNRVEKRLMLGFVPDHFLDNMLSAIYKRFWNQGLSSQFQFGLQLSEDNVLQLSPLESEHQTKVLLFLQKMYILENNDGEITIAPRITDEEFKSNTTIDAGIQTRIDDFVEEILDKFDASETPVDNDYVIFNYYLNEDMADEALAEAYQQVARQLLRAVRMIDTGIDIGDGRYVNAACQQLLLDCYHQLIRYDVDIVMFSDKREMTFEEYWNRFETEPRFRAHTQIRRLNYILNLLISVYAIDRFDNFLAYTRSSGQKDYLKMIGLDGLQKYIDQMTSAGNFREVQTSHKLTRALQHVISQIAS